MSGEVHLTARVPKRLPEADHRNAVRFCPKCGREIALDQKICAFCENTGVVPRPKLPRKQKLLMLAAILVFLLFLLFGLDWVIRAAGPLPTPVPTPVITSGTRGTALPVILLP